jgi:uncharacterized protein (TIGR02757 family)
VSRAARPRLRRARRPWRLLRAELEGLLDRFPVEERLAADPVHLVHAHEDPADREVAAVVASSLAFGRVGSLVPKAEAVLGALGRRPARALRDGAPTLPARWVHRWVRRDDMAWLLAALGRVLREDGSLLPSARRGQDERAGSDDLLPAMAAVSARLRAAGPGGARTRGRAYLVPLADGSGAAKRLCLLFRWLVRPADGVDLGLWTELGPARLTVPLDTHVARIGRLVGLTERLSPGWPMAREITASLRRLDPEDPTRFDFALSHLGIMGGCPRRRRLALCAACDLVRACRL